MRYIPLKSLPIFDSVARHLSFAKAAEDLNITIGAVSQQIKKLEESLNCLLFTRNTKQISLTESGLYYSQQINRALHIINDAGEKISPTTHGVVNINLIATLAMQWLIPSLADFQMKFPETELRIATAWDDMDLNRSQIDLAIVCDTHVNIENINSSFLWQDILVLIVPAQSQHLAIQSLLQKYPAIEVSDSKRSLDWHHWSVANKIEKPKHILSVANSVQGIQAVYMNAGIFVTHLPFINHTLVKDGATIIGLPVATGKNYYLIHKQRWLNHNVQKVKDWILGYADKNLTNA